MTSRSFAPDAPTPEQALRLALLHMATAAGIPHQTIAAALDLSPSHFSRAITLYPSEESHQRANFPADKLADYIVTAKDASYLFTLLDLLGYDPTRLGEIRKHPPTLAEEVREAKVLLARVGRQLELVVPLADQAKAKKTR